MYATDAVGEPDGKTAVNFAEAAFVQGSESAAELLATIYDEGIGSVTADKELASYWKTQSVPSIAFTLESAGGKSPKSKQLAKLDPWAVELPK